MIPIVEITTKDMSCTIRSIDKEVTLSAKTRLNADYYNPEVSHWEPVIEPIELNLDYIIQKKNPRMSLIIQTDELNYLNINVSDHLVLTKTVFFILTLVL